MSITIQCPKCALELEAPADLVGKPATCPSCESQFLVAEDSTPRAQTSDAIPAPTRRSKTPSSMVEPPREPPHASAANPPSGAAPAGRSSSDPPATMPPGESSVIESSATESRDHPDRSERVTPNAAPTGLATLSGTNTGEADPPASRTTSKTAVFKGLPPSPDETPLSDGAPAANTARLASEPPSTLSASPPEIPREETADSQAKSSRRHSKVIRANERRQKKAAKLVAGGSIESRIQLGADGTLPQLSVKELETKTAAENSTTESNPLVLIAVLGASVLMSVAMLFIPDERATSDGLDRAGSIEHLSEHYFGSEPFEDYQILIRQAVQHENRGDRRAAKEIYRRVLDMIHSEGLDQRRGLSGPSYAESPPNDSDLERHLEFLIRIRD